MKQIAILSIFANSHQNQNMSESKGKPHPHAENMRLYAEDAAETDKPWERWEYRVDGMFVPCVAHPSWFTGAQYRRKVKTIRIGDCDVPEPCRNPLKDGQEYWVVGTSSEKGFFRFEWDGNPHDSNLLKRGMIHITREAAEIHAKALISFTERKERA